MDLIEYINRGGIIVYILIALNILGFSIILWKSISILIAKSKQDKIVNDILNFISKNNNEYNELSLNNAVDTYMQKLEYGINTIKIIANIAPLLGLLGTVIGVLHSFDTMSKLGLGDPSAFSYGISLALITTVVGMIVAIPHFIAYNYFASSLNKIQNNIEKRVLKLL